MLSVHIHETTIQKQSQIMYTLRNVQACTCVETKQPFHKKRRANSSGQDTQKTKKNRSETEVEQEKPMTMSSQQIYFKSKKKKREI